MFAQNNLVGAPRVNSAYQVDTTAQYPLGAQVAGTDSFFGPVELVYGKAGGTIRQYGLVVCTPVFNSTTKQWDLTFTEAPNTANLGRALYVAQGAMTVGQYGWFLQGGLTPVNCSASVAADTTFGIAAAGQGGANSAGKQILGGRVIAPGSTTVVKACTNGVNGSTIITVTDTEGWFVGAYLSGTGVQATTTVTNIAADGRTVTLSLALNAAATGANITATYNNATVFYNVAHLNRPIAQGAIT